jgi:hypothetical protein
LKIISPLSFKNGEERLKKLLIVAAIEACSKIVELTYLGNQGEIAIVGTLGPDLSKLKLLGVPGLDGSGFLSVLVGGTES